MNRQRGDTLERCKGTDRREQIERKRQRGEMAEKRQRDETEGRYIGVGKEGKRQRGTDIGEQI
jgi:hypothetical protein